MTVSTMTRPRDCVALGSAEIIDRTLFARSEPTALLRRAIEEIAGALTDALAAAGDPPVVEVWRPLVVDSGNQVISAVSVRRRRDQVLPDLVLEVRLESTDRYSLGPKRLVYGRAGIPEFCFLDPQAGVMKVMRSGGDHRMDYVWPAATLEPGQYYRPLLWPGVAVDVCRLLPRYLRRTTPYGEER